MIKSVSSTLGSVVLVTVLPWQTAVWYVRCGVRGGSGLDIEKMPSITAIFDKLSQVDAVAKSHWKCQEDCPEKLRP
jgi:hypothetical protein